MAKVKLGSKEFDVDCEEIVVPWPGDGGRISDAQCVALGARMSGGEFQRLKIMRLVSFRFLNQMFAAGNAFVCSLSLRVWFSFRYFSLGAKTSLGYRPTPK
jgi:hypothetical protein